MSLIELAPEICRDFQRILDHLRDFKVANPDQRIDEIIKAIDILSTNPLIGPPADSGHRELVIGHNAHGYIARYRYIQEVETVIVLAIRSQTEACHGEQT